MSVNQCVTNFKNTREFLPNGQRICAEGTHNVKMWCEYFTLLWLLFCPLACFKPQSPWLYYGLYAFC